MMVKRGLIGKFKTIVAHIFYGRKQEFAADRRVVLVTANGWTKAVAI